MNRVMKQGQMPGIFVKNASNLPAPPFTNCFCPSDLCTVDHPQRSGYVKHLGAGTVAAGAERAPCRETRMARSLTTKSNMINGET